MLHTTLWNILWTIIKTSSEVYLYFFGIHLLNIYIHYSIWDHTNSHRPLRRWTLHMQTSFQDRNVLRSLLWKFATITDNNDLQVNHNTVKCLSYKYSSCLEFCMDGEGIVFCKFHMLETKAYFKYIKQDHISLDAKMNWPVTNVSLLTNNSIE